MSEKVIKLVLGMVLSKILIPILIETLFMRYYMGKFKVMVYEKILNKSYVEFLEKGIVGNKKLGYREVKKGEMLFVYTRTCWRERKE